MMKGMDTKELKKKVERYAEATGGRKTAVARARVYSREGGILINEKGVKEYFRTPNEERIATQPFSLLGLFGEKVSASVHVTGGGIRAQAEAVRNAIARALVKYNEEFKKKLRRAGFLTRDARMVERKKYGLKKARRAPQWAKR